MPTQPVPPGHRGATPYLIVSNAGNAIDFYKIAFGAAEVVRLTDPGGKVMHAELLIGRAPIMLADEFPDMGFRSAQTLGGSPVSMLLYVADVDTMFARAIAAGAQETSPVADQFDGDRRGTLTDPFGHVWLLASKLEDVSSEELRRRFEQAMRAGEGEGEGESEGESESEAT